MLLLSLAGGLGFWLFTQSDTGPKPVIPGSSEELAVEPDPAPAFEQPIMEPGLSASPPSPSATAESSAEDRALPVVPTIDLEARRRQIAESRKALVEDAPIIDQASAVTKPTILEGVDSDRGKPTSTEIFSEAIVRASLARGLRDHEPVGIYKNAVSLDDQDLITVYMFTQTRGYVGEEIFHNWYLNDEQIAQVVVKPWISPMRASSSKKIIPVMTGDWRVEIVDASGTLLAITRFEVVSE